MGKDHFPERLVLVLGPRPLVLIFIFLLDNEIVWNDPTL
jgi:hypothetical protein